MMQSQVSRTLVMAQVREFGSSWVKDRLLWMTTTFVSQDECVFSQNVAYSPRKGFLSLKGGGGEIQTVFLLKRKPTHKSKFDSPMSCFFRQI